MENATNGKHDVSYIRARLEYVPEDGDFFWKPIPETKRFDHRWNVRWAGKPAGAIKLVGQKEFGNYYRIISVDYRAYMAHRLAWCISHGEWPASVVDHIDRNTLNNRIDNLRVAGITQNRWNSRRRVDNTSGYKGVSKDFYTDKWLAQIWADGKHHRLGTFQTKEEAFAAYCDAGRRLHGEYFSPG
jgi:hypothetical protein